MARVEHVALWVKDLESMRRFYVEDLGGSSGPEYVNPRSGFRSYFISFGAGARIELMASPSVNEGPPEEKVRGYAHLALSLGSREQVDELTKDLVARGIAVASELRVTGDGYYESVIRDPEGNRIELTV